MVFYFAQRDKADLRDSAFFPVIRFSHLTAQMSLDLGGRGMQIILEPQICNPF